MGRFKCCVCKEDMGPSETVLDSHGICDECGPGWMEVSQEEWDAMKAEGEEEQKAKAGAK